MTLDRTTPIDRRRLLVGAAGTLAGLAAGLVGAPRRVAAANGALVKVGSSFSGTDATIINNGNGSGGQSGLKGVGPFGIIGASNLAASSSAGVKGVAQPNAYGVFADGKLGTTKHLEIRQTSSPGTPPTGRVWLWARSNGSGGTELVARFANGTNVVLG